MMICGDLLSVTGLLIIFASVQSAHESIVPILIGVTISAMFVALLAPAYKATVTDILPEEQYAKASGMLQMAGASKYLVSPFLAGLILAVTDIRAILLIDMATVVVTVAAIAIVRRNIQTVKRHRQSFHFLQELRTGMRSITSQRVVRRLVLLMAFVCFFVGIIQTLLKPMVLAFADVKTLGYMESISAVGMLAGSIILASIPMKRNIPTILIISLMAAGICMAMIGTTTSMWSIIVFCFLFFATLPFINACADVLIRVRLANDVQGRA